LEHGQQGALFFGKFEILVLHFKKFQKKIPEWSQRRVLPLCKKSLQNTLYSRLSKKEKCADLGVVNKCKIRSFQILSDFSLKGCTFVVYIVGYSQGFFSEFFETLKLSFKILSIPIYLQWLFG
jgi:hypothetical protein